MGAERWRARRSRTADAPDAPVGSGDSADDDGAGRVSALHLVRWTRVVFDEAHLLAAGGAKAAARAAAARALHLTRPRGDAPLDGAPARGGARWALVDRARSERMWRGAPAPLRAVADAMGLARAVPLTALRASVSDVDKCIRRLQRDSAPLLADDGSEAEPAAGVSEV